MRSRNSVGNRLGNYLGNHFGICLGIVGPLSILLTLLGCYPEPSPNPNITTDGGPQAATFINFVHASTDVAALDVYIDKQKQIAALDYRKSSGNRQITPQGHSVELRTAGADPASPALLTANITLIPGSKTLLTAIGRAAAPEGPSRLQLVAATYGTVDGKSVKLRLLNAVPAAPTLEVSAGVNAMTDGAEFGAASGYGAVAQLPAATKFGLRPAHTTTELAFVTLPAMATPGSVLTLMAFGELSPATDDAHFLGASVLDEGSGLLIDLPLTINDMGPGGTLYLVHAAADAPAVDVVSDKGTMLATSLAYKSASPLVELIPGTYTVYVRPAGTMTNALTLKLKVLPDLHWTLIAHGLVANPKTPLRVAGLPRPLAAPTSWRLANTLPEAPVLSVTAAKKQLQVGYGQASAVMAEALPGPNLVLRLADKPQVGILVTIPKIVLDATQDQLVTVVAAGPISDSMKPPAVLAVLDNTADSMMPPMVIPLMTAPAPM